MVSRPNYSKNNIWDSKGLAVDPVAVTGGLAGYEDAGGGGAAIDGLMRLAGGDLDSLACLEGEIVVLDLHGEFAMEDVEELAGAGVVVAGLAGAGRHELFDDAEVGSVDEVPAVAVGFVGAAPGVVLGGVGGDGFGRH
jgi:hypothetical protein